MAALTRRQLLTRLGLVGTSSLIALAAGEGLARWLVPARPRIRLRQFTDIVEGVHRFEFDALFRPDTERFWKLAPGLRFPDDDRPLFGLISNAQGFRQEGEVPRRKPAGELRVICLGDSCTFGYLQPHDETYVFKLERKLAAALPGRAIRCINAGVPGYSLFQGWRYLETELLRYQPDLVTLNFGWNDLVAWDGRGDLEHYRQMRAETPPAPLDVSRLCQLAWRLAAGSGLDTVLSERPRLLPYEFRALLESCREATDRAGAELLVLLWGARPNVEAGFYRSYRTPLQEEQARFGRSIRFGPDGGPALVDGVAVFEAMARTHSIPEIFADGVHPTAAGADQVARAMLDRIGPWARERLA